MFCRKFFSLFMYLCQSFINNMAQHNDLGARGEQTAREFLRSKGYSVYDRNIHIGHKELDIVATHGNRIVFVEVKTRTTDFKDPLDAVDAKKIARIVRAADSFLRERNLPHEAQFDIIVIIGSPESSYTIDHYEDAFFAPLSGAR